MYIYLASCGSGWHKVGISGNPAARRGGLNVSRPVDGFVALVDAFRVPGHKAYAIEARALSLLRSRSTWRDRHQKEWFRVPAATCKTAMRQALRANGVRKIHRLDFTPSERPAGWVQPVQRQ